MLSKEDCRHNVNPTLNISLVESLIYLVATQTNIMYMVSLIPRFMEDPKDSHWKVGKRILRYVTSTKGFGILYGVENEHGLVGYIVGDWARSLDDRKSTFDM